MRLFDKLSKQLETYLNKQQIAKIKRAFLFANDAHKEQVRASGEPYITHPVAVAGILANMRMDPETIMAALLHDIIEDTGIEKKAEIAAQFGNAVAELVDGTSKLAKIKFSNKVDAQAENFRKMLLAIVKDIRVILVKLADRLHNMRTITSLQLEKRRRIINETLEIYVPLANRLGMYNMCTELENLYFQSMYPKRYAALENSIQRMQGRRKGVINTIQKALLGVFPAHKFKYLSIIGREKHLYSIYRKMRSKRTALTEIMDMYAFRIIVETVEDCYRALGFVHKLYKPVAEHFKDYIAIPKANGYQSLHTILFGPYGVPVEIQIRTCEMDTIAERGIAAHWNYKQGHATSYLPNERTQTWLQNLLELQQKAGSSLEFIKNVKENLFTNEIYVFTPKGEIIELPHNATIVDFAYEVHSDIGNHCVAGKIDRQLMPLNTKLNSGQTIEVVTSKSANPNVSWLNFAVTGKARSSIRFFIKKQHRSEAIDLGECLLNSILRSLGTEESIDIKKVNLQRVLAATEFKTIEDLYFSIAQGHHNPLLIAQHLITGPEQISPTLTVAHPVSIKGAKNLLLHFSPCCFPIPGDKIVGCLEVGRGINVHTNVCQNVVTLSNQTKKYFPLCWDEHVDGLFAADLRITVLNQRGILGKILQQLTAADIDIENFKLLAKESDHAKLNIIVLVKSRQHLATVLCKLRVNKAIMLISRNVNSHN